MRILVLQESDWLERGPHQSHHLLERLRARGHEVRVVDFEIGWQHGPGRNRLALRSVMKAPPKVVEGAEIEVVRPTIVHLPLINYASAAITHRLEMRRQLREFRPHVVLGLGILDTFTGIRPASNAGVPFVYYLIDELHRLVPEPYLQGVARVLEQANLRRATLVLSINQSLRDYTLHMGAPEERSRVLPAGVDIGRYLSAGNGSKIRTAHGLQPEDVVLIFMGWVYPFSGVREVAADLIAMEASDVQLRLLVVGRGDSWDEIGRMVTERHAEERIKLVGFRPFAEMPSYLAAADVCLLPARRVETMLNIVPIKVYEYLASGKPVIATRLPGLLKEFGEGHGVIYVDDPREVVQKVKDLIRKGALKEIGEQGRAYVAQNDWENVTDRFESLLEGIIRHGSGL